MVDGKQDTEEGMPTRRRPWYAHTDTKTSVGTHHHSVSAPNPLTVRIATQQCPRVSQDIRGKAVLYPTIVHDQHGTQSPKTPTLKLSAYSLEPPATAAA